MQQCIITTEVQIKTYVSDADLQLSMMLHSPASVTSQHQLNASWRSFDPQLVINMHNIQCYNYNKVDGVLLRYVTAVSLQFIHLK